MTLRQAELEPRLAVPPTNITLPSLFLDMDGVLAPIVPTPDAVVPDPRRTAVIRRLDQALSGRVAILSGRTLADIDRISDGAARAASGVHGLERRRGDGSRIAAAADPAVRDAVAAFRDFARDHPGILVEDKGVAAGLHYRQSPDSRDAATELAGTLARRTGLSLQPGHMVLELKTPGSDKGRALDAFMQEAPFAGSTPIMLGDDLTDEYGFEAATRAGGFGVLVGPPRSTAARYGLDDVDAVLDWLERVALENA